MLVVKVVTTRFRAEIVRIDLHLELRRHETTRTDQTSQMAVVKLNQCSGGWMLAQIQSHIASVVSVRLVGANGGVCRRAEGFVRRFNGRFAPRKEWMAMPTYATPLEVRFERRARAVNGFHTRVLCRFERTANHTRQPGKGEGSKRSKDERRSPAMGSKTGQ